MHSFNIDTSTPQARRQAYRESIFKHWALWRRMVPNFHVVDEGKAYRSAQCTPASYRSFIEKYGIKTVFNFRGMQPDCRLLALEAQLCEEMGVELVHLKLQSRDIPQAQQIRTLHELLTKAEYPILIHCKGGADRAGLVSTLYQHWVEGRKVEDCNQLRLFPYQHFSTGKTGLIDYYFQSYVEYTQEEEAPLPLLEWTEQVMDRKALKANFQSKPLTNFIVDQVLRRE